MWATTLLFNGNERTDKRHSMICCEGLLCRNRHNHGYGCPENQKYGTINTLCLPGAPCLIKTELIRQRRPLRAMDAVKFATQEWVDRFNHHRLLEPIGNIPPVELEPAYYRHREESATEA